MTSLRERECQVNVYKRESSDECVYAHRRLEDGVGCAIKSRVCVQIALAHHGSGIGMQRVN